MIADSVLQRLASAQSEEGWNLGAVFGIDDQGKAAIFGDPGKLNRKLGAALLPVPSNRQASGVPNQRSPTQDSYSHGLHPRYWLEARRPEERPRTFLANLPQLPIGKKARRGFRQLELQSKPCMAFDFLIDCVLLARMSTPSGGAFGQQEV